MEKIEKVKCAHCKKTLQPVGSKRHNGANHKDWNGRQYHKKCFKELQSIKFCEQTMRLYGLLQ